jgi:hypothetical protein
MDGTTLFDSEKTVEEARSAVNQNPPEFQIAVNHVYGNKVKELDEEDMARMSQTVQDIINKGYGCDERLNDNTGNVERHLAKAVLHSHKVPHYHNVVVRWSYPIIYHGGRY